MSAHKATLAELNERIKLGPYHQWLGVEVTDLTEDEVIFHIPFRDEMMVHPERHYTHGGILATIIDMAADYAI
ncbi:MAG: phenylacetic acid degradation protein, partial [Rhodospirillaceae bacterium]|nr:phenylacetic acid degradation protein [Rhodospirillaceae bacterium]